MHVYMKLRQRHWVRSPRFRNEVRRLSVNNSICLVGVMEGMGTADFYHINFCAANCSLCKKHAFLDKLFTSQTSL